MFLAAASVLLVYWLMSLAAGPEAYARAQAFFGSWLGMLVMLGCTFSLFFHLCNGIRHLFWDIGIGFEIETVYRSGAAVVVVSMVLTVLAWIISLALGN